MRGSLPFALLLALAGCATSPGRSVPQTVRVETPGCARASCTLTNPLGRWQVEPTPGEVTLTTAEQPLEIACRAPGETSRGTLAPEPLRAVSVGSGVAGGALGAAMMGAATAGLTATPLSPLIGTFVAIGAAVGAGTGLVIDASRRSWAYPSPLVVAFACDPLAAEAPDPSRGRYGFAVRSAPPDAVEPGEGATVSAVAAGGPAALAGLRVGDRIVAIDGQPVGDAATVAERLVGGAEVFVIAVVRLGQNTTLRLPRAPSGP